MEECEFVIPSCIDELQEYTAGTQYFVKDVLSIDQLKDEYQVCRANLDVEGAESMLSNFDIEYSSLVHFANLSPEIVWELWDVSFDTLRSLVDPLHGLLEEDEEMSDEIRAKMLRYIKMAVYIFCELMMKMEERQLQEKARAAPQKGRKKNNNQEDANWCKQKGLALGLMFRMINLPLRKLWKPANNVSEDFLDLISKSCLKLLEDREIAFVNMKYMRDSVFQVLSHLCKEYAYGKALVPQIIQLVTLYDHLPQPVAQSMTYLEKEEGHTGMLYLAMEELSSDIELTSKAGSNCGQFLFELTKANPEGVSNKLELLTDQLDQEPYSVRNGAIEAVGHLLLTVYKESDLHPDKRKEKKEMLEILMDHLKDSNAFSRGKSLQVWRQLCEQSIIPNSCLLKLIKSVQNCVLDKSSNVRKDAIKLMKAFLDHNPYLHQLRATNVQHQLAKEMKYLENIENSIGVAKIKEPSVIWDEISADVLKVLEEFLKKEASSVRKEDSNSEQPLGETSVHENNVQEQSNVEMEQAEMREQQQRGKDMLETLVDISSLLKSRNIVEAVVLALSLVKKYDTKNVLGVAASQKPLDDNSIFSDENDENVIGEDDSNEEAPVELSFDKKVKALHVMLHQACVYLNAPQQENDDSQDTSAISQQQSEELQRLRASVAFLKETARFAKLLEETVEQVFQLLSVSQTGELVEAIDFVATAQQFGLLIEETGMTKILSFVHSKDQATKASIINAYKRLYLGSDDPESDGKQTYEEAQKVVKKICSFIAQVRPVHERSIKVIINSWVESDDINNQTIRVLLDTISSSKVTRDECLAAMNMLSLVCESKPEIPQENISILLKCGLGKRGESCFNLVRLTCRVLACALPSKLSSEALEPPFKLPSDHEVFQRIVEILKNGLYNLKDKRYLDMTSESIEAIFKVADNPENIANDLLRSLCKEIVEQQSKLIQEEAPAEENQPNNGEDKISPDILMRFMHAISCISHFTNFHLNFNIRIEMRRRNFVEQKNRAGKNTSISNRSMCNNSIANSSLSSQSVRSRGSASDDDVLSSIQHVSNVEILDKKQFLGLLAPVIENICMNHQLFKHTGLRVIAVQALSRFMMVSRPYCEAHLQLFVTKMVKSQDFQVRITGVHCMADILCRFPNETDPYTPNLYMCLKDSNIAVRRETLVVLSKLVLEDMLRVKFQISYIAMCLIDEDQMCQDIACNFFAKLSTKGNILYNLVLDMVSQLSSDDFHIDDNNFEKIMKIILPYIDKERQVIMLVEKLCGRFPEYSTESGSQDIAVCLQILKHSTKSIRVIIDSLNLFSEKLKFPKVKQIFDNIIKSARKQFKGENKDLLDEFEKNLNECSEKVVELEAASQKAVTALQGKTANPTRQSSAKNKKTRNESSEEESSNSEREMPPPPPKGQATARPTRQSTLKNKKAQASSSEEESDFSGEETPPPPPKGKVAAKLAIKSTRKNKKALSSEEESELSEAETPPRRGKGAANTTNKSTRTNKKAQASSSEEESEQSETKTSPPRRGKGAANTTSKSTRNNKKSRTLSSAEESEPSETETPPPRRGKGAANTTSKSTRNNKKSRTLSSAEESEPSETETPPPRRGKGAANTTSKSTRNNKKARTLSSAEGSEQSETETPPPRRGKATTNPKTKSSRNNKKVQASSSEEESGSSEVETPPPRRGKAAVKPARQSTRKSKNSQNTSIENESEDSIAETPAPHKGKIAKLTKKAIRNNKNSQDMNPEENSDNFDSDKSAHSTAKRVLRTSLRRSQSSVDTGESDRSSSVLSGSISSRSSKRSSKSNKNPPFKKLRSISLESEETDVFEKAKTPSTKSTRNSSQSSLKTSASSARSTRSTRPALR